MRVVVSYLLNHAHDKVVIVELNFQGKMIYLTCWVGVEKGETISKYKGWKSFILYKIVCRPYSNICTSNLYCCIDDVVSFRVSCFYVRP